MRRARLTCIVTHFAIAVMLALADPISALAANDLAALNAQVGELYRQGKYREATEIAKKALALTESTLGAAHPDTLASVNNLGLLYRTDGRYAEAEPLLKRVLASREKALGREHPDTLTSVNNLGALYQMQGRYGDAEPLLKRALASREKALGREHLDTLQSVNNLGFLYQAQSRYAEAEPLFRRALAGYEKALGPAHPSTLLSVNNLGLLYQAQGHYGEVEPLWKRALAGYEKALGPTHPSTLLSVNNLGFFYQTRGRYAEAEALLKRALAGYEKALGPAHPSTLLSVSNLGTLHQAQGRDAEAEPLLKRALAGREKVLGWEHTDTLASVNNLAVFYQGQGRNAEAESLYQRVLVGREKTLGPAHQSTLLSVNNLGNLYRAQGRYAEAEPLLKRALAGYERALGPEHPDTLTIVSNLGLLYQTQGRNVEAEPLNLRALAGREKALGPEHPDTLTSVNNLALLYRWQGRYEEAEPLYLRALAGREKTLGPEHPDTLWSLSNLSGLYYAQGDWRRAAQFWRRSTTAIGKRVQRGTLGAAPKGKTQSEAQQKDWQFWGLIKVVYRLMPAGSTPDIASAGEMFQTAQWVLSSEAAQSLTQMAARGAKGDPTLATVLRERQDLVDEWQRREQAQASALGRDTQERSGKAEAENRERMAGIDRRIAEIDRRLKTDFPDYAALVSPAPLSVEEAQALLGADEALVLFLDTRAAKPTPEETFIWVVTKTQMRWVRSDLGRAALAREVQTLRCGLDEAAWNGQSRCLELTGQGRASQPLPFDHARANRLYKGLFGQVEDLIKDKHLLIVPSGALTQLPFAVLLSTPPAADGVGKSPAWLIRDHALTVLPAVSSLKALRAISHSSAATRPLIGFGNPLLDGPDNSYGPDAKLAREKQRCPSGLEERVADGSSLRAGLSPIEIRGGLMKVTQIRAAPPLPETADELCQVAREVGGDLDEVRLGSRATEREIKALSAGGELAKYRVVHFATHGAMAGELSRGSEPGLVLTPPDQASDMDDGYLSASEIAALKLDADWVILSACNTAAGQAASAEALSGLARAFIYAQARALLVSHWAVASSATVKLVTASMREIGRDRRTPRAEALRRAMLSLIDSGDPKEAHPAYWAPFIVVGEGSQ
jgi:CHAT domain-containing protein/Tfp pilus assembly protein PilF